MWSLAVTRSANEFSVRDQLCSAGLQVFLPYIREKHIVSVTPPKTTATPRPRVRHEVMWRNVARWPGYIFAKIQRNEDLNTLLYTRGVLTIVRTGEAEPATLSDHTMDTLRIGCAVDGQVLKLSELHGFEIGDLLRFVKKSSLAGRSSKVLSVEDNGDLRVLIDGRLKATVHYTELTSDIG